MDSPDRPSPEDLPSQPSSDISPDRLQSYRAQLTRGEDAIDPATWAGSVPAATGVTPRVRVGRDKWFNLRRNLYDNVKS